jgi:non-canonical purine NTP pyrophosphatase (RdgB/HAM1 family)
MIYFITGNKNKFSEAKAILSEIEQLDVDLPEIQEINSKKVIEAKLIEASKHHSGSFIVEDTSLSLDCFGDVLPGPLIRWFDKTIANNGICEICERFENNLAHARVTVGYMDENKNIEYFEGDLTGTIVRPRGDQDWAWGLIFVPEGQTKTFGEMTREEKNSLSMRKIAFEKLKTFLKI